MVKRNIKTFTPALSFLVPKEDIAAMYDDFRESFPLCHAVFATIVTTTRSPVAFAECLAGVQQPSGAHARIDELYEDAVYGANMSEDEIDLTTKQRAILDVFMMLVRIRSQKKLPYWSMVSPLGKFAIGDHHTGARKGTLDVGSCLLETAFERLDALYEETEQARIDLMCEQRTSQGSMDKLSAGDG